MKAIIFIFGCLFFLGCSQPKNNQTIPIYIYDYQGNKIEGVGVLKDNFSSSIVLYYGDDQIRIWNNVVSYYGKKMYENEVKDFFKQKINEYKQEKSTQYEIDEYSKNLRAYSIREEK